MSAKIANWLNININTDGKWQRYCDNLEIFFPLLCHVIWNKMFSYFFVFEGKNGNKSIDNIIVEAFFVLLAGKILGIVAKFLFYYKANLGEVINFCFRWNHQKIFVFWINFRKNGDWIICSNFLILELNSDSYPLDNN